MVTFRKGRPRDAGGDPAGGRHGGITGDSSGSMLEVNIAALGRVSCI
jgi:hypothetical protein